MSQAKSNKSELDEYKNPIFIIFMSITASLFIGFIGLGIYKAYFSPSAILDEAEQVKAGIISDNCKGGEKVGNEYLTYDIYYDNGNDELPVCRLPKTPDEIEAMHRENAYRQGLIDGTIDPEDSVDEQCAGGRCW